MTMEERMVQRVLAAAQEGEHPTARKAELAVVALLVATLAAAPLLFPLSVVNDLGQAICLGLFAIGFNILFKYSGLLSFGHAAFFGAAAYGEALLLKRFPDLPLPLLVLAAALGSAALGLVIGQIAVRRAVAYFSMTTLAIAAFIAAIAFKWDAVTGGTDGLDGFVPATLTLLPGWHLASPALPDVYAVIAALSLPLALLVWALLELTPYGNAVRTVRNNEERADFLGYDTHRIKLANFGLAAFVAGWAGALWAIDNNFVATDSIDLVLSTKVIIIAFLGGCAWYWGPVIGSILYIAASDWLSGMTEHWQIWLGLAFILMVLFCPGGIAGLVRRIWGILR